MIVNEELDDDLCVLVFFLSIIALLFLQHDHIACTKYIDKLLKCLGYLFSFLF